jgi:hypothetical protein
MDVSTFQEKLHVDDVPPVDDPMDFVVDDIDTESLLGHLYLTSNLHNIPVDYPSHFYKAADLMTTKCKQNTVIVQSRRHILM